MAPIVQSETRHLSTGPDQPVPVQLVSSSRSQRSIAEQDKGEHTAASNMSISGAPRPTNDPFSRLGPG